MRKYRNELTFTISTKMEKGSFFNNYGKNGITIKNNNFIVRTSHKIDSGNFEDYLIDEGLLFIKNYLSCFYNSELTEFNFTWNVVFIEEI